jgi:hypothetical protein
MGAIGATQDGIAEIRRLKAGRRCAGIRGKRLAIVCTARIGESEFVEERMKEAPKYPYILHYGDVSQK